MKPLFNYAINEGTEPEAKDIKRLEDIMTKSGGDENKAVKLAQTMAHAIKDTDKMQRRYKAALRVFGDGPVAAAFNQGFDGKNQTEVGQQKLTGFAAVKQNNPEIWNNIVKAFKVKKLNFENVQSSKIIEESPEAAFKYGGEEGDKYFKVWMRNDDIAFVTWANTMIDTKFRWNAKAKNVADKRDNNDIIGTREDIIGYLKSTPYYKKCTSVFRIPFDAFGPAAVEMVEDERNRYKENVEFLKLKGNATLTPGEYVRRLKEFYSFVGSEIKRFSDIIEKIPLGSKYASLKLDRDTNKISFSDSIYYGPGDWRYPGEYAQKIWCDYRLPDLSVGTYDWDGYLSAVSGFYDKKRIRELGIKPATSAKQRFNEVKKLIKSTISQEDLEYLDNLYKTRNEIKDNEKVSGVSVKYSTMVFQKLANIFPIVTYARNSIINKNTARAFIDGNRLVIHIPFNNRPGSGTLAFKLKRDIKNWGKTLCEELMKFAPEIFEKCIFNENGRYVEAYFKKSFMDSIKTI